MSLFRNDEIPIDREKLKQQIQIERPYIWVERELNVFGLFKVKTGLLKKVYTVNEKVREVMK